MAGGSGACMSEQAMRAGSAQLAAHWAANKGLVMQLSTLYSAFPHLFQERDEILTRLSTLDAKSLSVAEVKQAYKKASLRLHPDRVRGRSTAYKLESEEVLKQLTMAHADTSQWFKGLKLDTSSSYYGSGPSSSRTTHARSSSSASASKPLRPGPPRPEPLHKDDCDSMEPPPFMPPGVADFAAQRRRQAAHGGGGSGGGNGGGNGDGKGEADRGAGRPRSRRSHHHRRRASVDGAGCPRMAALAKELEEGMDVSTAAAAAAAVAVEQVVAEQLEKGSIGRAHAAAKVYGKRPERSAARRRARADGAAAEENGSRSGCGSGRGGAIGESSPEESWERVGDHPAQLHGQADCARPFCSRMPGVSREASSSSGVHAQQSGTTDDEVSVAGTSDTDVVVESDGDSGIDIEVDHDEQYDRDNHGPSVEIDAERTHNHQPHDQGLDEFDDFASLQEVRSRLMQADGPNANVAASSPAHLPAKLSTHSRCTQRAQVAGTGCCHSVACGGGDGAASRRLVVREPWLPSNWVLRAESAHSSFKGCGPHATGTSMHLPEPVPWWAGLLPGWLRQGLGLAKSEDVETLRAKVAALEATAREERRRHAQAEEAIAAAYNSAMKELAQEAMSRGTARGTHGSKANVLQL